MKNKQRKELAVCGFETVRALATQNPEKIQRLFFTKEKSRFFGPLCKQLATQKKIYRIVEDKELEKLSGSMHHQGVVAMIHEPGASMLDFQTLMQWARQGQRFIALDRVGNTHNLGAIIRSAAFFGIQNVVLSKEDQQAYVSTSTYRVAQGGMEFVQLWQVESILQCIDTCKGKILCFGADHRGSLSISNMAGYLKNNQAVVVILGNEETGLSKKVQNSCDYLVQIPGTQAIESLNVAQAATLFLYELTK